MLRSSYLLVSYLGVLPALDPLSALDLAQELISGRAVQARTLVATAEATVPRLEHISQAHGRGDSQGQLVVNVTLEML